MTLIYVYSQLKPSIQDGLTHILQKIYDFGSENKNENHL